MKSYLLLRDNQQSGPYTFNEIKQNELQPYDLVWIEGESKSWSYPTEINELQQFVSTRTNFTKPQTKAVNSTSVATFPQPLHTSANAADINSSPLYNLYEDVKKEMYEGVKISPAKKHTRRITLNANLMALFLILIGVSMSAFVMKNVVASFSAEEPIASAEAREIESISYESEHAAMANHQAAAQKVALTEQALQISDEALPAKPTESEKQQLINDSKPAEILARENEQALAQSSSSEAQTQNTEQSTETAATEVKEEPKKEEKKVSKDVRSQMNVSGGDYKVGVLGGITDHDISVSNGSSSVVDRATVEVNYLKPNGSVVGSKTVEVRNIQPGGSKKVSVPPSNRGSKVSYRIIEADAQ